MLRGLLSKHRLSFGLEFLAWGVRCQEFANDLVDDFGIGIDNPVVALDGLRPDKQMRKERGYFCPEVGEVGQRVVDKVHKEILLPDNLAVSNRFLPALPEVRCA